MNYATLAEKNPTFHSLKYNQRTNFVKVNTFQHTMPMQNISLIILDSFLLRDDFNSFIIGIGQGVLSWWNFCKYCLLMQTGIKFTSIILKCCWFLIVNGATCCGSQCRIYSTESLMHWLPTDYTITVWHTIQNQFTFTRQAKQISESMLCSLTDAKFTQNVQKGGILHPNSWRMEENIEILTQY